MKNKAWTARVLLLIFCAVIAGSCIWKMNQTYDPLARYPYATDTNRQIILKYMSDDDIDYIITQKIKPDQFLDFIEEPDFSIHNTLLYSMAKNTQKESNSYIVNFINKYREHFSLDTLKKLLSHYSYEDLTNFFETEHLDSKLISDPSEPYVTLDSNHSVYKYVPKNIKKAGNIYLQKIALKNLKNMQEDYATIMNGKDHLDVISGYLSYEELMNQYINLEAKLGEHVKNFILPAGHNEQQLGYTVVIKEAETWNELCVKQKTYVDFNYDSVRIMLDEKIANKMNWIQNNCYRYRFVLRYPY